MVVGFVAALTRRDTLEHSRIDRELPTAGADPPPAGVRSKASS
jgi:hypothetical protein